MINMVHVRRILQMLPVKFLCTSPKHAHRLKLTQVTGVEGEKPERKKKHRSAAAARLESQSRKPKPVLAPQQKASLQPASVQAALASSCQSHHYAERTRCHTEEHRM